MEKLIQTYIIDVGAGEKECYEELIRTKLDAFIYAIEPHSDLAKTLRDRFKDQERVKVYEFACTAVNQPQIDFYLCNRASCSSTLPFQWKNLRRWKNPVGGNLLELDESRLIVGKTLSTFIKEEIGNCKRIAILNIDVQGDALNVLKGIDEGQWQRIEEIRVKVHTIDWELYQSQAKYADVKELILKHDFILKSEAVISRGQELYLVFFQSYRVTRSRPQVPQPSETVIPKKKKTIGPKLPII